MNNPQNIDTYQLELLSDVKIIHEWRNDIITIQDGTKFLDYIYNFINQRFKEILLIDDELIFLEKTDSTVNFSIYYCNFFVKSSDEYIYFYFDNNLLGKYSLNSSMASNHELFNKPLNYFRDYHITKMLQHTFALIKETSIKIQDDMY